MNNKKVGGGVLLDPFYGKIVRAIVKFEEKHHIPTDDEIWLQLHNEGATKLGVQKIKYRITHSWRGSKNCKLKLFDVTRPEESSRKISVDWKGLAEELWSREIQTTTRYKTDFYYGNKQELPPIDSEIIGEILRKHTQEFCDDNDNFSVHEILNSFLHAYALYRAMKIEDDNEPVPANLDGIQRLSDETHEALFKYCPELSTWMDNEPY